LFILYINDLCNITDTNIFVASYTKDKVYNMANKVLEAVSTYIMVNLLHIYAKKSCYTYSCPFKQSTEESNDVMNEHNLYINSKMIQPLFTKHELLTVENLYRYRSIMELFKIIKTRTPISLFSVYHYQIGRRIILLHHHPTINSSISQLGSGMSLGKLFL
jgi:hypothetical protein